MIDHYVETYRRLEAEQALPVQLRAARDRGLESLSALGLPNRKSEPWHYTDLAPLVRTAFTPSREVHSAHALALLGRLPSLDQFEHRLIFVDGHFEAALSTELPKGVVALPMHRATDEQLGARMIEHAARVDDGFAALNAAFCQDGAWIRFLESTDAPLALFFVSTGHVENTAAFPLNLIELAPGVRAEMVEIITGSSAHPYLLDLVTDIELGEDASLSHARIFSEGRSARSIGALEIRQAAGSQFESFQLALGGQVIRNQVRTRLEGERAQARLGGLYLCTDGAHIDNYTHLHHIAPECVSDERYKGIVDEGGEGSFTGRVVVDQAAAHSVAHQKNQNLLLSDKAIANTRPQLEIYAKEVEASHGATVGQLQEDQLFYLRARGLTAEMASALLKLAFAGEMLEQIPVASARGIARSLVLEHLGVDERLEQAWEGIVDE